MSDLDLYLKDHYWDAGQLAASCNIAVDELDEFIRLQLVPEPSYVVTDQATVKSFVFGEMAAPGSTPGAYFHPVNKAWVLLALSADYRRDAKALQQLYQSPLETFPVTTLTSVINCIIPPAMSHAIVC